MSLFRREVFQSRTSKLHGRILLTQPLSFRLLTILALLFLGVFFSVLILGEYTQKQRVSGILLPNTGLLKIHSPQQGMVASVHVREGDLVEEGQLLFVVYSHLVSSQQDADRVAMREHLLEQQVSLNEQGQRQGLINQTAVEGERRKLRGLKREMQQVTRQQDLLREREKLSQDNLKRLSLLHQEGVGTLTDVQTERASLLALKSRRLELERDQADLSRQIEVANAQLQVEVLRGENELARIERDEQSNKQAQLEKNSARQIKIVAPAPGRVTGIMVHPGQVATRGTLASILPEASRLQAELYAPSHAISFIRSGMPVLLRYHAFPYQKFGQHRAFIKHVSKAPIVREDEVGLGRSGINEGVEGSSQTYRITVTLPSQTVVAYGDREPLQAGMELEADILLDTRRLHEWLLEPLFSIVGQAS